MSPPFPSLSLRGATPGELDEDTVRNLHFGGFVKKEQSLERHEEESRPKTRGK